MELKRISAADNSTLMKIKQNRFCIKKNEALNGF